MIIKDYKHLMGDGIITYPYGTNAFKTCESDILMAKALFFEKLK